MTRIRRVYRFVYLSRSCNSGSSAFPIYAKDWRKIVLSPGSLNSTFETISFTKLDPNLIIQFQTKMHVVLNEFLILNSRLNIQSYSRTRKSGETSSSRRRPPFLLHFLLLVLLSTAAGRSTNQSKISSSSSYMYVLLNQQNLVFFFCCWKSVWRF